MSVTLRDAQPSDRDAVRELTLRAYGEYAAVMEPAAWAALEGAVRSALASHAPAERIVAEQDGALVGSVMLYPPAEAAYGALAGEMPWPELRLLAVAPGARGGGIARLLVDECIRRARRMGATAMGLHTSRSMRAAIRLYERMGFVRDPARDFQPDGAEVVEGYRLDLTTSAPPPPPTSSAPAPPTR